MMSDTAVPKPPPHAVAFVRSYVGYDWKLSNGRYRSCPDWREWLKVFGGECELETAVDFSHEPDDTEFAVMMGWGNE